MKKTIKRLGAIFLAMAMAVSVLCTGVLAADDDYTITINRETNDGSMSQFSAYQIFAGKVDSKNATLSDITWGVNISENGKTELLKFGKNDGSSYSSPAKLAEALTTSNAKAFAVEAAKYIEKDTSTNTPYKNMQGQNTISVPKNMAGYYLIKNDGQAETDTAYTNFVLKVAGNTSFSPKTGIPTVDKKVNGKDTDTAQIGDKVTFTLTGTLPDNYDDYTTYKYVFHDTLSSGLTLDENSITVKAYKNGEISEENSNSVTLTKGTDYTVTQTGTETTSPCNLEVAINNLKSIEGLTKQSKIVVTYTATLNSNAVIAGNDNTVHLEYSNDPNGNGTGNTTDKKVTVYTLQLDVVKIDGSDTSHKTTLNGAKFILSTDSNLQDSLSTNVNENGELVQDHTLTNLIAVKANTSSPNYVVDDGTSTNKSYVMEVSSDSNTKGQLNIKGLKSNTTYYLYETKAPDGYNKLTAPVEIKIDTDGNVVNLTTTDHEIKTLYIENKSGSTLPSTGGMGTTLFYVVGGALMAGAAIVLVIKKKRSSAE